MNPHDLRSHRRGQPLSQFAAAVQLLHRMPRTVRELAGLIGTTENTVRRYLQHLIEEGLVDGRRAPRAPDQAGGVPILYTWNKEDGK